MKSFKDFLNEGKQFPLEQFKKDCKYYLDLSKNKAIYHGRSGITSWVIESFKERSGPKNSSPEMHKAFNEFFKELFGVNARNWLFTTSEENTAHLYGKACAIFPIGKFEWVGSTSGITHDLTALVDYSSSKIFAADYKNQITFSDRRQLALNDALKQMKTANWHFNERFEECIDYGNEIMIKCDKFYLIPIFSDEWDLISKEVLN